MIPKATIEELKSNDLPRLYRLLSESTQADLKHLLENLGRLPNGFEVTILEPHLDHPHHDIRYLAVKNLGKLAYLPALPKLFEIARHDADSMVRREAVSAIGRMRSESGIQYLRIFLYDNDPKVVLQALRGLLVFKQHADLLNWIKPLFNHPNEQIQQVIEKEFKGISQSQDYGEHRASPDFMKNVVVLGDVQDVLKIVPSGSVHLTFTSPPYYNARDYSIYSSYEAYLDFLEAVFQEVHRVTKEGRYLIVNTSPIIIPRISREYASKRYPIPFDLHARLMRLDWEFIDDIVWAKPESSVKNRIGGFAQHRKPLAYKPNAVTEYLMVYRKASPRLIDWNIKAYDEETVEASKVLGEFETSNLWEVDPTYDKVHSAVFPRELCHRVIQYYSYVGDLVFDPFGGSGTMGKAALDLERYFFLTELNPTYFDRMKQTLSPNAGLFEPRSPRYFTLDEFIQRQQVL